MSNRLNSKNTERFTEPVREDMAALGDIRWWGGHTVKQATLAFHWDWQGTYILPWPSPKGSAPAPHISTSLLSTGWEARSNWQLACHIQQ